MSEGGAGAFEEGLLAVRDAQRIGADDTHTASAHVAQALPEALEARDCPCRHVLVDAAVLGHPRRQPHHLAQTIDDHQLAVRVTRDHHVEAIGA